MVSTGVSWRGRTDIFSLGTDVCKVGSARYIRLLADKHLNCCRLLYPGNYSSLQDVASTHHIRQTQQYLTENTKQFINKDGWSPTSPDLTPLEYSLWNAFSEEVYDRQGKFVSTAELREAIKEKGRKCHWSSSAPVLDSGSRVRWRRSGLKVV